MRRYRATVGVAAAVLAACGNTAQRPPATGSALVSPSAPTPTPVPQLAAPAIIQVENSAEGRPQSGLAAANVVYEYVAEGGIGRFSLMFFGPPPVAQEVGPVRSARTVTVQLAQLYEGFVAYSGASTYIGQLLREASYPSYDENGARGNLFRLASRDAPHNLYTNGQDIARLAAMAKLSGSPYQLWPRSTDAVAGGTPVSRFAVDVSPFERPVFSWDPLHNGFTRTESTGLAREPSTGDSLVVPTVIVQQVAVTTDRNVVDVAGHYGVDQAITGSGSAQVFTGGREYGTTWTQPPHGPPQFTLADGQPAPIAPGEVWISLVPVGQPAAVG